MMKVLDGLKKASIQAFKLMIILMQTYLLLTYCTAGIEETFR